MPPIAPEPARRKKNAIKGARWPLVAKGCTQALLAELQACWCSHGKHAGARRPTLGCNSQFTPPTWSIGGELSCASQAFVRKSCAKCGLRLFAGRKSVVRTPTNRLVPELQPLATVLHCLCRAKQANAKQSLVAIKQALVGDGYEYLFSGMRTASHGSNSGTSLFVGVLATDLRPANNPNMHFAQPFRTKACEAHASSPPRTTLVVRIETLHPKVGRRAPVCFPWLHQHTGARRSTLGCKLWPQGASAVPFMTVACASHVLVCGKGSTDVLGLFAGCKSIVRTPTNTLVPELEPCEAVPMPNRQPMPTRA